MKTLIAIDGSPGADIGVRLAAGMAWPSGTSLRVITVMPEMTYPFLPPDGVAWVAQDVEEIEQGALDQCAEVLDDASARLAGADRVVETALIRGRSATSIVAEANRSDADLVIIGSRGHGALASLLLGSVSAEVVDHLRRPVLVARSPRLERILIADDGSDSADRAARLVEEWPILRVAHVAVVGVAPFPLTFVSGVVPTMRAAAQRAYQDAMTSTRERARARVDRRVAALRDAGLDASGVVADGDPAGHIVRLATAGRVDLVIVGTRAHTGLTRFVLGSTARNVLLHAPCSVLVAKGPVAD